MIPRDDLIWLAGLAEGEACFDLHKGRSPRIRVGMTDKDTVQRVASLLGSSCRLQLRPAPYSALWHAEIQGERAAVLMEALLPLMGARRSSRIALALGAYRLRATA